MGEILPRSEVAYLCCITKVHIYHMQDVAGKILSFAQKGPRGICVLSANGAVSNVTIRQPGSSGGILTYEASYLINALSLYMPFAFSILF